MPRPTTLALAGILLGSMLSGCGATNEPATRDAGPIGASTMGATASPTARTVTTASPHPAPNASGVEKGPNIKVIPLVVTADTGTFEVSADGIVTLEGKQVAIFVNDELWVEVGWERPLTIAVRSDGKVFLEGENKRGARFDDQDNLVSGDGGTGILIDDQGKVDLHGMADFPVKAMPTLSGFKPESKREAALVVMVTLIRKKPADGPAH
jgi:hypothetical protein